MAEIASTTLATDANLRAYYRFSAGALLTDSSPNGFTLTNNNTVTPSVFVYGDGADFGSGNTNKSFTIANDIGITGGACSIVGWFKLNSEIGADIWSFASQADAGNDVTNQISYSFNGGTRRLEFWRVRNGVAVDGPTYNITLGTTNSYHIGITYDGTNVRGYVNGALVAGPTASTGNGTAGAADEFRVARDDSGRFASLVADDVAVFSRALSAAEILTLYTPTVFRKKIYRPPWMS